MVSTLVKSAVTSKLIILVSLISLASANSTNFSLKAGEFFMCAVENLPKHGVSMLANHSAKRLVAVTAYEMMGLIGTFGLWSLGTP